MLARGKKKTQTLSFDVLVAVGVFISAVIVILYLVSQPSGTRRTLQELTDEGETISSQLISSGSDSGGAVIVVKNKLQKDALADLAKLPYNELKSVLGIKADFCIHFEDEDGNLIDIENNSSHVQYSIGSKNLNFTVVEYDPSSGNTIEYSLQCGLSVLTTT